MEATEDMDVVTDAIRHKDYLFRLLVNERNRQEARAERLSTNDGKSAAEYQAHMCNDILRDLGYEGDTRI